MQILENGDRIIQEGDPEWDLIRLKSKMGVDWIIEQLIRENEEDANYYETCNLSLIPVAKTKEWARNARLRSIALRKALTKNLT